jgi:hypothetical protein
LAENEKTLKLAIAARKKQPPTRIFDKLFLAGCGSLT